MTLPQYKNHNHHPSRPGARSCRQKGIQRDAGCGVWCALQDAALRYNRSKIRFLGRETMDAWKKALVFGSVGAAVILFMKKRYPAGVLATGAGLAILASEYPDQFERVRQSLPDYFERGMHVMEMAARAGKRITEAAGQSAFDAWDEIGG